MPQGFANNWSKEYAPDHWTRKLLENYGVQEDIIAYVGLGPREIEILSDYYGLKGNQPQTLEEIGNKHGLTRERVRQIRDRSLRRLKKSYSRGNI